MQNWLGAFVFGVELVFISQQVKITYCVSEQLNKYEKKILLVGTEGKNPRYATKQSREEVTLLGLMVEISKQQRQTVRAKSCCPKGKAGAEGRETWASMWGGLFLSVLIYSVSRERALCSPGEQVSEGTSHAVRSAGEAAVKGRCGKLEGIKATPLCASSMKAESLPFITSPTGVLILVTVVFRREDSFWCLLIPENKRKKGCQGNRHPERLTENSG